MLKTLKEQHFPGLFDVLGAESMSQADIMVYSIVAVLRSTVQTTFKQLHAGETNAHYVTG